jgi:hypothetical protein
MNKMSTAAVIVLLVLSSQYAYSAENPCIQVYEIYKDECVGNPKSDAVEFIGVNMRSFQYYSNTFNQDNFWVYCREAKSKPADYNAFKKNVCSKNSKALNANVIYTSGDTIKTRHGNVKLIQDKDGYYSFTFKNKYIALSENQNYYIEEKGFKLNNVNVFIVGWCIGVNGGQGAILIIDRPDGVFTADVDYDDTPSVKSGKLIFERTYRYKKNIVWEFDGNTLTTNYDYKTDKWRKINVPLTKLDESS